LKLIYPRRELISAGVMEFLLRVRILFHDKIDGK
jgi:hypothetical protein